MSTELSERVAALERRMGMGVEEWRVALAEAERERDDLRARLAEYERRLGEAWQYVGQARRWAVTQPGTVVPRKLDKALALLTPVASEPKDCSCGASCPECNGEADATYAKHEAAAGRCFVCGDPVPENTTAFWDGSRAAHLPCADSFRLRTAPPAPRAEEPCASCRAHGHTTPCIGCALGEFVPPPAPREEEAKAKGSEPHPLAPCTCSHPYSLHLGPCEDCSCMRWEAAPEPDEGALEKEVAAVLDELGSDAVRVREGGGPENLAASLAVSVAKVQRAAESACAEVERLKRERDDLRERKEALAAAHEMVLGQVGAAVSARREAEERVLGMREALRRFGVHQLDCQTVVYGQGSPCTCGLRAIRASPEERPRLARPGEVTHLSPTQNSPELLARLADEAQAEVKRLREELAAMRERSGAPGDVLDAAWVHQQVDAILQPEVKS